MNSIQKRNSEVNTINTTAINVQLMAKREGNYPVYVFKNLENQEYMTVTLDDVENHLYQMGFIEREINIGEHGTLKYETRINENTGKAAGNFMCSFHRIDIQWFKTDLKKELFEIQ